MKKTGLRGPVFLLSHLGKAIVQANKIEAPARCANKVVARVVIPRPPRRTAAITTNCGPLCYLRANRRRLLRPGITDGPAVSQPSPHRSGYKTETLRKDMPQRFNN